MRFGVMAVTMKITVFWDVTPCNLVDIYRFRLTCCLHHQGRRVSLAFLLCHKDGCSMFSKHQKYLSD
jgi:hypothetical protein